MPTLTTAADLHAWTVARAGRRPLPSAPPDAWLDAAAALRLAVLNVPGVAGVSDSAQFQTRGRGPAVDGVALAQRVDGGAAADIGVRAYADVLDGPDLPAALGRAVASAVRAAWDRQQDAGPLDVRVHVVDVAGPSLRAV